MRNVTAVAVLGVGLLFAMPSPSRAAGPLGYWHGEFHNVPRASCADNCKILGGGTAQGDDYDFTDSFPANVLLDANDAHVECSNTQGGNGCVFMAEQRVSVDNVAHKVYTHVKSRSAATQVRAVVAIYSINQK